MYTIVQYDTRRWWILRGGERMHTSPSLAWAVRWVINALERRTNLYTR